MATKIIFEDSSGLKSKDAGKDSPGLTPFKHNKLIETYKTTGILNLPKGYFVRTIQGIPGEKEGEVDTIIIIRGDQI